MNNELHIYFFVYFKVHFEAFQTSIKDRESVLDHSSSRHFFLSFPNLVSTVRLFEGKNSKSIVFATLAPYLLSFDLKRDFISIKCFFFYYYLWID